MIEQRLREHTALEADRAQARHARAAMEVAMRRATAARRREAEEAAGVQRRSAACVECGRPDAAGLCPPCSYTRRTDLLVQEAVDVAVAVRADLDDVEQVAQLTARCEADPRTLIAEVCRRRGGDEVWAAYAAQEVAEQVRDERRAAALRRLTGSEEAVAVADAAYEAALRRRPRALIVVDNAVHLRTYGARPLGSRYEEISEIARCLRKPMINLRDSGALEDNADVVILLHREDA